METRVRKSVKNRSQLDDQVLISEALLGNQQAFTCLMERYQHAVHHMIAKIVLHTADTDDLTIEVFSKAFHNLGSYRPHFAFSTWLFRIAINHSIDHLRKKRVPYVPIDIAFNSTTEEDAAHTLTSPNPNPEELIIRKQRAEHLQYLMSRLSSRNRLILEMHYFDGFSYEEIAQDMGVPVGTVKAQLHRAREAMYLLIKKNDTLILYPQKKAPADHATLTPEGVSTGISATEMQVYVAKPA